MHWLELYHQCLSHRTIHGGQKEGVLMRVPSQLSLQDSTDTGVCHGEVKQQTIPITVNHFAKWTKQIPRNSILKLQMYSLEKQKVSRFPQKRETAQTLQSRREYASLSPPSTLRATCTLLVLKPISPTHTGLPAPTQQPPQPYAQSVRAGRAQSPAPWFFRLIHQGIAMAGGGVLRLPVTSSTPSLIPVSPWNQLEWMARAALEKRAVILRKASFATWSNWTDTPYLLLLLLPSSSILLGAQRKSSGPGLYVRPVNPLT